jgi:predicted glycosyltransferase
MFDDTEKNASLVCRLTYGGADVICTPDSFGPDLGPNHIRYPGLHELAYLHPNQFSPDPKILGEHGVAADEPYCLLRFVGWDAHHDTGVHGFSPAEKRELVSLLSEYGSVYITSEDSLPAELAQYQLPLPPEHVHHLLAYANLLIGDSQTMTCEAGVLGTPAVRYNSIADPANEHAMYLQELEELYELVYSTADIRHAFDLTKEIIRNNSQAEWDSRRKRLLNEKIDVTEFMLELISAVGSDTTENTTTIQGETIDI